MKTLIVANSVNYSCPCYLTSFSQPYRKEFLRFLPNRCVWWNHKPLKSSSSSSLEAFSASYGGWDDFGPESGESHQLLAFLSSIRINDKKHVITFLLGLVCAFSISRFRVSSIVVFPASVLVFAFGFSLGFVRGGGGGGFSKRRLKEEVVGRLISQEKLGNLVGFLDSLDAKACGLENDLQRAIDNGRITAGDLENYVGVVKSMRLLVSSSRKFVNGFSENAGQQQPSDGSVENQKPGRRRKDPPNVGFEPFRFIGSLFGEREKLNNVKQNPLDSLAKEQVEGRVKSSFLQDSLFSSHLDEDKSRASIDLDDVKTNSSGVDRSSKRFTDSKRYDFLNSEEYSENSRRFSLKMHRKGRTTAFGTADDLLSSVDLQMEAKASFMQDQVLKKSHRHYWSSTEKDGFKEEASVSRLRKEKRRHMDDSLLVHDLSENLNETGSSSSLEVEDDILFSRYLAEANNLQREARGFINGRHSEEHADFILQKSANLLSKAIDLKPMSLLAVGQLGNTYLLHGEIKLRISQALRSFLSRGDSSVLERWGLDTLSDKDKFVSHLICVCELCEELLVKAGRTYKLALSIDGSDVRSLYNWGLSLSFRARLIADTGPEAASEADKLFMAAIDKFDAMISRGNAYLPEALFRWGMAAQERSRLRPNNSKEKLKLLQQATRLYKDALDLDSDIPQAREALSWCMSELDSV